MAMTKEDIKRVVEDMERKTVCLYRVSTDKQGTEDDTPTQRNECREYAKNMGFEIVEELVTKISGFKVPLEEREDLNRVKELVREGRVNTILLYHSDRLARQTEAVALLDNFSKLGIQVYSTKEGLLNGKEHIDGLLSFIRFWQSSGESKKISMRVKDAIKVMNENAQYTGGCVPYGFMLEDTGEKRNSKKTKTIQKIVPHPQESQVVNLIFNLALTKGWGATRITKYLNEHGYKTRKGKAWRHNRISSLLRNTVYKGFKRYDTLEEDTTKEHKHLWKSPSEMKTQPYNKDLDIVGEEIFDQVQHLIDMRSKRNKAQIGDSPSSLVTTSSKYGLLSGLVVCHCGHKLVTNSQYKKQVRKDGTIHKSLNVSYRCPHSRSVVDHGKRNFGSVNIDRRVEKEVIRTMENLKFPNIELDPNNKEFMNNDKQELKELKTKLNKKEIALKNTEEELERFMLGESDFAKETLSKLLTKLTQEVSNLKTRKLELEKSINQNELTLEDVLTFKEKYNNWGSIWEVATFQEKQQLLSTVIDYIEVGKHGTDSRDIPIKIHFKVAIQELTVDNNPSKECNRVGNTGLFIQGNYKYLKFTIKAS